ncbi:MAG: SCO family protein [Woeseiaceae bacterium]
MSFVATVSASHSGCEKAPVPAPEIDVSFELIDESGNTVTSDRYSGRLRLVFFGFASCPDICPITLHNIGKALNSLGPLSDQVTVLFISVDPKRDTPDKLRQYTDAFHPAIIGLTGSYDQILAVTSGFRTTFGYNAVTDNGQERPLGREEYELLSPAAAYVPYHSSQVYLIGANDELLDIIGYGSQPPQIEAILRKHIKG